MSILFAGTSLADFDITGTVSYTNDIGGSPLNFYECLQMRGDGGQGASHRLAAPVTEIWLQFGFQQLGWPNANMDSPWFRVFSSAYSTTQALFEINCLNADLSFRYWDGAAWQTAGTIPQSLFSATERTIFNVHIKMDDTTGVFEIYKERTLIATMATTDLIRTTATTMDTFKWQSPVVGSSSTTYWTHLWNVFMADEDTRPMEMMVMYPNTAGALAQWTGTAGNIDDYGYNDADTLSSGTTDFISTFNFAPFQAKFQAFDIKAVALGGRAQNGVTAPTTMQGIARVSGVNHEKLPEKAMSTVMGPFNVIWNLNPATSAPWTGTEVQTTQFGFKSAA